MRNKTTEWSSSESHCSVSLVCRMPNRGGYPGPQQLILNRWRYANMKNEPNGHIRVSVHKQGSTLESKPPDRHLFQTPVARAGTLGLLLMSFCGIVAAQGDSPSQLRQFIDHQVGTINKLKVPATDAEIPLPRLPNGTVNPRYRTTEEKRYLGKLLFHDPIRTARIDPAYGGVPATAQTGSCGSCHLG
jgi:hypothetical protein